MISNPFSNIKITCFILVSILVAQEIIFRVANRQRMLHHQLLTLAQQHEKTLDKIKVLCEILPICSICDKLRTDEETWTDFENYLRNHLDAEIVKGICRECAREMAGNFSTEDEE